MAKMDKGTVCVTDNETDESVSYLATVTPKRTTLGNSYFGTLNYKGIAKLQTKWPQLLNEKAYLELLRTMFKACGVELSKDDIGDRGGSWNTPEARERYSVTINDALFNPPLGKQALKLEDVDPHIDVKDIINAPVIGTPDEVVVLPEPAVVLEEPVVVEEAVADTTAPSAHDINLAKLIGAIKKGIEQKALMAMMKKASVSDAEATTLWNEATAKIALATPAEPEFNFEI